MIQRLGDGALRLPRPRGKDEAALLAVARTWPGVIDACLTEEWLAVYFHDDADVELDESLVAELEAAPSAAQESREMVVPVRYDGEDLAEVARTCGMTVPELRAAHAGATYTVLFLGFMPGFAYLGGLPKALEVPRLRTPRTRVPKNAVAIAGPYAGVYPFASPGGWRLLGTAQGIELFGANGALLRSGDRVRFEDVTRR